MGSRHDRKSPGSGGSEARLAFGIPTHDRNASALALCSYNSHTTLVQLSYNCRTTEGNMDELKACPFCGKEAVMETFTTAMEKVPRFRVRCSNCTADLGWDFFKAEDAKKAWNQRTE